MKRAYSSIDHEGLFTITIGRPKSDSDAPTKKKMRFASDTCNTCRLENTFLQAEDEVHSIGRPSLLINIDEKVMDLRTYACLHGSAFTPC